MSTFTEPSMITQEGQSTDSAITNLATPGTLHSGHIIALCVCGGGGGFLQLAHTQHTGSSQIAQVNRQSIGNPQALFTE